MSTDTKTNLAAWRILAFGKKAEIAAKLEERLLSQGYRATCFALTDDAQGDARLVAELAREDWDGVSIGGFVNGQDSVNFPATEETTRWFNRVLNLIHSHAPKAKILLPKGADDVIPAIHRELGPNPAGSSDASGSAAPALCDLTGGRRVDGSAAK